MLLFWFPPQCGMDDKQIWVMCDTIEMWPMVSQGWQGFSDEYLYREWLTSVCLFTETNVIHIKEMHHWSFWTSGLLRLSTVERTKWIWPCSCYTVSFDLLMSYKDLGVHRWAEGLSSPRVSLCPFRAVTWSQRLLATIASTTRCWLEKLPASSPCQRASCCVNGPTSPDSTKSRSDHDSASSVSVCDVTSNRFPTSLHPETEHAGCYGLK